MKTPKKLILVVIILSTLAASAFAVTWALTRSPKPDQAQAQIIARITVLHPELKEDIVISRFFAVKDDRLYFKTEEFMHFHINSRIEKAEKDFNGTANANADEVFKKAFKDFHEEAAFFSK